MSETATWQPSASIPNLLKRAAIMAEIRRFFADRGVLEVETPCMSQATVTDIHLVPFETRFVGPGHSQGMNLYLMTSPEYHMKRLLVAGCGPVFQLCRSFRNEEMGRHHNPEFTMLEWYRPHYDMYRLMNEVDDLLQQVLEAGRNAPTAHNNQPQRIFVLQAEGIVAQDAAMFILRCGVGAGATAVRRAAAVRLGTAGRARTANQAAGARKSPFRLRRC